MHCEVLLIADYIKSHAAIKIDVEIFNAIFLLLQAPTISLKLNCEYTQNKKAKNIS